MWLLWQQHYQEEDCWFLLIDAHNAFNEENCTAMMWAVRFECPSVARFTLNCYRHWARLVIRAGDGTGHLIFSKEGATQGDPLAMVTYGLKIPPLICELRQAHPGVIHPWYADDAGSGGTFEGIWKHSDDLMVRGNPRVYFLNPTKSILVVYP